MISESERTDAKNCFYPIIVKDNKIVGFGNVSPDDYHPEQTVKKGDEYYVYPIDRQGVERKWRYARQTVESIWNMLRPKKTATGYDIELGKTFGVQKTVWDDKKYDANEYGTKLVLSLPREQRRPSRRSRQPIPPTSRSSKRQKALPLSFPRRTCRLFRSF